MPTVTEKVFLSKKITMGSIIQLIFYIVEKFCLLGSYLNVPREERVLVIILLWENDKR